jgi:hypothetical protein
MRKINFKNIALVIGVSIFDIAIGAYDRIVNNTGFVKGVSDWYASMSTATLPTATVWNASYSTQLTTSASGFGLLGVVLLVIIAVGILSLLVGSFGAYSA